MISLLPLWDLLSFYRHKSFSWGRALKLSNAVLLAVGISVEFPKVLEGVKGGDFVRTSQLCPHSISSHFFFSCWTSLKLLPRSSKEEAECCWKQPLDQRQNWTAAVQEKKKTLWPIIYLWGKHIWCWFFRNWQAICSKALQKANIILSLLRLFQVGSKWGRSLLSFFFWVISFFHVFLSCLLSAPWLSITADYSLRPDFNPPVCVYVFQPALLIMWVFLYLSCFPQFACVLINFFYYLTIYSLIFVCSWVSLECVCVPPSSWLVYVCVFIYIVV